MAVGIRVSSDVLDIFVTGLDRLFGFRGRLEIPMNRVTLARKAPRVEMKADLRVRTAGLGFPGLAAVGHFRGSERKKQWWRVWRADEVLVIDLMPHSQFDRLVIQVEKPGDWAARINDARQRPPVAEHGGRDVPEAGGITT